MPQDNPDRLNGPGRLSTRQVRKQLRERARKSVERDGKASINTRNALAQKASRWQRFVRYVRDKRAGKK